MRSPLIGAFAVEKPDKVTIMKVKLLAWCMAGRQGEVAEMSETRAKALIAQGLAEAIDAPKKPEAKKPAAAKRKTKVKKPAEKK